MAAFPVAVLRWPCQLKSQTGQRASRVDEDSRVEALLQVLGHAAVGEDGGYRLDQCREEQVGCRHDPSAAVGFNWAKARKCQPPQACLS